MKYFKKMVGEKVYLSPMNVEDVEIYTKWMNDRRITDNLGNSAFIFNISGEKEWLENHGKNGDANFAIIDIKSDELIGNCSLMGIDRIQGNATIGIYIGEEEYRSKGYGTDALNLLLDFAFNIQNLHNVDLHVFSFNERAIKCYKKVGFKEYGRRHNCYRLDGKYYDEVLMEILQEDYRKSR